MTAKNDLDKFLESIGLETDRKKKPQIDHAEPSSGASPDNDTLPWTNAKCWSQSGDGFFPVADIKDQLPAGAYRPQEHPRGPYLEKMPIEIDKLLTLSDSAAESLISEFKTFWTLHPNFKKRGFTFKRGLLLFGAPGSGKTSAIWQMTKELVKNHNGVVFFIENPYLATACINIFRRIEPERPMITVMEDIDALVEKHGEHGYLALLDGESQISNVVHIATTNYPQYLDKRFVDRPSRFDTIMHVGMPSAQARREYFQAKEHDLDKDTLERWVELSDGYSVAHLREIVIAIRCFNQKEKDVFDRLDKMREQHLESDGLGGEKRQVGFHKRK